MSKIHQSQNAIHLEAKKLWIVTCTVPSQHSTRAGAQAVVSVRGLDERDIPTTPNHYNIVRHPYKTPLIFLEFCDIEFIKSSKRGENKL
jgi:hypothetical protein